MLHFQGERSYITGRSVSSATLTPLFSIFFSKDIGQPIGILFAILNEAPPLAATGLHFLQSVTGLSPEVTFYLVKADGLSLTNHMQECMYLIGCLSHSYI